jgi:hypothetical protein
MIDISQFAGLVSRDHGLAVIALALPDGTVHASVASAGVLSHPLTGVPVVGVVAAGRSRKLVHLRRHPRATVVLRAGFQWAAVEGPVELAGPDDPLDGTDASGDHRRAPGDGRIGDPAAGRGWLLLLVAAFRSVTIPLVSALLTLLSTGAAYGVIVAVFQCGWLGAGIDNGATGAGG